MMGERQDMTVIEPKRYRLDDATAKAAIREAVTRPLIVEIGDHAYRIHAEEVLPQSPYTIDSVYGSLPPINGRHGSELSNEELEAMIDAAKEANAKDIFDSMNAE